MPQVNRRSFLKAGGTAGVIGLSGCLGGITGGGGTPTIRMSYVVPVENYGSLMGIEEIQSELPNMGDAYEFEITSVSGTPAGINSMAAGELDLTYTTTVSFGNAMANQAVPGGAPAIATDFWDAHEDYYGLTVYSAPDSDITEAADMEGAQLGVNAVGTGIHFGYVKALAENGLTRDDVEFVEIGFPSFDQAIQDGRLDVGIYPAFFAPGPRSNDFTKVYEFQQYMDAYPFAYINAAQSSLDEKGDAIRAWGEDLVALFELSNTDREMVVDAATQFFELPDGMLDGWYLTENDYYREGPEMDIDALSNIMGQLVEHDYLEEDLDWSQYATNDYLP